MRRKDQVLHRSWPESPGLSLPRARSAPCPRPLRRARRATVTQLGAGVDRSQSACCQRRMNAAGSNSLTVASDLDSLTRMAADPVIEAAANPQGNRFRIALSGGSTPRRLFELLSTSPFRERVDWTRWCVFWADERLVPPDHADSNYQLAEQLLLSRVAVPREHVHRAPVEIGDGDAVARAYAATLRDEFELANGELPAFDLGLL